MHELTILRDYRGAFYSSTTNIRTLCSMNIETLSTRLSDLGWTVTVAEFPDVNFQDDWSNKVVLYQSAEDPELKYKSFIEDIILGLSLLGANVVPGFPYLRAHHNKVFMEILCKSTGIDETNTLPAKVFGTYEDFHKRTVSYPVIAKAAEGAGSSKVVLLNNRREAESILRKMTHSNFDIYMLKEMAKHILIKGYSPYSFRRQKFILQDYIPGLTHDYKVLIYGERLFVLRRAVRTQDFRASGSGDFSWPRELPAGFLDFVWKIFCAFDVPHASLDIAESEGNFHLLEAQFVSFGPLTVEKSAFHWVRQGDDWSLVDSTVELEAVFAEGFSLFASKKGWFAEQVPARQLD